MSSADKPVASIHTRDIVAARFVLPKRIHAQTDKAVHSRNQAVAQAETGSTENVDLGQVGPENDEDLQVKTEPVVDPATADGGGQS
ncbi:hypothetical protein [Sinorhizobium meliloti]|uniref:hypothetical protein n=1 Tax=Rhizobium meliloti TaxID=382 RepID=UPI003F5CF08B